jgi:dihydroflavonol-4-reductase
LQHLCPTLKNATRTMKKILVTGGNGFIGSRLVKALTDQGYAVRCLLRKSSKTSRIDGLNYEPAYGDVTDLNSIVEAMKGCDGVMHLASLSNWADIHSPKMESVVVGGSKNVLEAARQSGNLRMVYVSSSTAIDGTDSPTVLNEDSPFTLNKKTYSYAYAKKRVEAMCIEAAKAGLPVVMVNPAEVYGPNDYDQITSGNLIDFIKSDPCMVCKGGTAIVHVDDVADGIIKAFEKGRAGERYFLGGENLDFTQIATITLKLAGKTQKTMLLPNGLISFIAKVGGALKIPLPFNPAVIPYAVKYWFVSNQKARTELGATFRGPEDILRPTVEWIIAEKLV